MGLIAPMNLAQKESSLLACKFATNPTEKASYTNHMGSRVHVVPPLNVDQKYTKLMLLK